MPLIHVAYQVEQLLKVKVLEVCGAELRLLEETNGLSTVGRGTERQKSRGGARL